MHRGLATPMRPRCAPAPHRPGILCASRGERICICQYLPAQVPRIREPERQARGKPSQRGEDGCGEEGRDSQACSCDPRTPCRFVSDGHLVCDTLGKKSRSGKNTAAQSNHSPPPRVLRRGRIRRPPAATPPASTTQSVGTGSFPAAREWTIFAVYVVGV
jgi:hypothetical protein